MLKRFFEKLFPSNVGQKKDVELPLTIKDMQAKEWFADNGDKTLRLFYPLTSDSVVFDVGGYHGDWAAEIFCKYACNIYIFEPVKDFADLIRERFSCNPKVRIYPFGLSDKQEKVMLGIAGDGTSAYKQASVCVEAEMQDIVSFLNDAGIKKIDLMKINIEGGEYALLEHMLSAGVVLSIDNLQIQFHDFMPDAEERRRKIQVELARTHHLTYQYDFIWENWERNSFEGDRRP